MNGIHLAASAHGVMIILAIEIKLMNLIHQKLRGQIVLADYDGEALGLEGLGV